MKRAVWMVVLSLAVVSAQQPVWAARTQIHVAAESQHYGKKFAGMIGRGAINVLSSPVDIITNTVNETRTGPPLVGTLAGFGKGVGCGLLRLGSGAIDLVTFWLPGFNGIPVSDSYDNCLAGGDAAPAAEAPMPAGYGQPSSGGWDVPTSEPGAAQVPASEPAKARKTWSK